VNHFHCTGFARQHPFVVVMWIISLLLLKCGFFSGTSRSELTKIEGKKIIDHISDRSRESLSNGHLR
jgi:hypothetical protein